MHCSTCGRNQELATGRFCAGCGASLVIEAQVQGAAVPPAAMLSVQDEGRVAAAQLAAALQRGWRPEAISAPIARYDGESVFASVGCQVTKFSGATVGRRSGWAVGFGSPLMLAATVGGSLLYNAHQKNKASRESAPQWRLANDGMLYVTDRRFALQGRLGWNDVFFSQVRASEVHADGVVLFVDGQAPIKYMTQWPEWFFVMFQWLAYKVVPEVALDARLRAHVAARSAPAVAAAPGGAGPATPTPPLNATVLDTTGLGATVLDATATDTPAPGSADPPPASD